MASTKFYLDKRNPHSDLAHIKICISHKAKTIYVSTGIYVLPSQWDEKNSKVIGHPQRNMYNQFINQQKMNIDALIIQLKTDGRLNKVSVHDIKQIATDGEKDDNSLFANRFLKFTNLKVGRTHELYMYTYTCMDKYEENLSSLHFEDITKEWLAGFDLFLSLTSPSKNARNIHLRNIRAVFNDAIDDEITTFYPFRKFKIRNVATAKRSLTIEQLRTLFDAPVEEHQQKYLDMFKLIFFLVGINIIDLCNLKEIHDGRIEYNRAKTSRLYSIKVEPEAMEIIERYRGERYLLNMLDRYSNYKDFAKRMNENLQLIGEVERVGRGGKKVYKPLFPQITSYWARHSWATIASELDIPKETISAALGHEIGSRVTSIYINFDAKKIDEANRKVIDWVLYGKR